MPALFSSPRARLALLLLLALLVKAALVLSLADVFFYGEELEKGAAAKALIDGLDVPYHAKVYHPYEGGGFVVSHLKALAFLAVGQSVLAHKLAALVFVLLVLVAGWTLARRHFGDEAAFCFGLFFLLAPASVQKLSLLGLGIHFEATFFALVVLDRTARLLAPDAVFRPRELFTLGLAAGFGIYFSYQLVLVAAYAGVSLLVARRGACLRRESLAGLGGLALGLLPLFWMAWHVGRGVLDIHGTELTESGSRLARFGAFLAAVYAHVAPGEVLWPLAWALGAWAAWQSSTRSQRRMLLWLGGFVAFWFVVYLNSAFVVERVDHDFAYMRFAPVWALATLVLAVGWGRGWRAADRLERRFAYAASAALLAFGLAQTAGLCAAGRPGTPGRNLETLARTKGYDYGGYIAKVWPRLAGTTAERVRALLGFREPTPPLLYADLAAEAFKRAGEKAELIDALLEADPDAVLEWARGLGDYALYQGRRLHGERSLANALRVAREYEDPVRGRLVEGLGRVGVRYAARPEEIAAELAALPPLEEFQERGAYLRGVGYRFYRRNVLGTYSDGRTTLRPDAARLWLRRRDARDVPDLLFGFDEAEALHRLR